MGNSFDFAFQTRIDKGRIDLLATSGCVRRKEVVLLWGPGRGQVPLAAGLGVKKDCRVAKQLHTRVKVA